MRLKVFTLLLWIISAVSIILALKASNEPIVSIFRNTWFNSFFQQFDTGNSIVFDLSIGFLVSVFFYFLVAWYPNRQRKKIIKQNFEEQYRLFKEEAIRIFLFACQGYSDELSSKLSEQSEFRKFFTEPVDGDSRSARWYDVLNGLKGDRLKELLVELEVFMNEVAYVLNNVEINDTDVFSFFKRLSQAVYRLKNSTSDYEDVEQLSKFLWELFAGWSFIDGYRTDDIIKVMISKI
jgi:hypothetical protein